MNKYDGLFIVSSSLNEEALEQVLSRIHDEIGKHGGEVRETRVLGRRTFARQMKKWDEGLYVKIFLDMPPEAIPAFLARMKLNEDVFRVQILRSDDSLLASAEEEPAAAEIAAEAATEGDDNNG